MEMVSQIKGVCDIRHVVHSGELFALRHANRNGSNEQDVCDMRQTGLQSEMCVNTDNNIDD